MTEIGPIWITLIASLVLAIILLGIRVFVMLRIQQRRQRENRQEAERLRSLVAVYRSLAGSFTPGSGGESQAQMEEALSEIVLFGSLYQVELAAQCINTIKTGGTPSYQKLIEDLRAELRSQLGLEPIPGTVKLPDSGPGQSAKTGRSENNGRSEGRGGAGGGAAGGGGGAGGSAAGGMVGIGGLGAVAASADLGNTRD